MVAKKLLIPEAAEERKEPMFWTMLEAAVGSSITHQTMNATHAHPAVVASFTKPSPL
jgi:hypothetical protein